MTPDVLAELRAAGFTTGLRRYPGQTFHYARARVGLHSVAIIHGPGNPRGFVAFEHAVTGRAGYTIVRLDWLASAARAALADLAAGRDIPRGFHARTRPLQVRLPSTE
jgi:hypothetical protein